MGSTSISIIYKDDNNIGFTLYFQTWNATSGASGTQEGCGSGTGSTGVGGNYSEPSIVYDLNCPTISLSSFVFNNFGIIGPNGGEAEQNGSYNYTSSGSGVNTKSFSCDETKITNSTTGKVFYSYNYNYPNGPYGNPGQTSKMTLPGSKYSITSQGGGNTVTSSGYGSGGGCAPISWKINGTSQGINIGKAGPGFIEIMSTYIQ